MAPRKEKVYRQLASAIDARARCEKTPETHQEWFNIWSERIDFLVNNHLPSGSGVDNGTQINLAVCNDRTLVLTTSFHHMDEGGSYDGWSDHGVVVTASLVHGISIRVTGKDRNGIKDYLADLFREALCEEVDVT